MAKKRRSSTRRRRTATTRRRRSVAVASSNPPRRRRHYRRNPPFSVNGVLARVTKSAIHGGAIVGGEMGARLIRSRVFGKTAGTMVGGAIELAAGVAIGLATERFLGADIAQAATDGAFAGVIRAAVKQISPSNALIQEALGDGGRRKYIITRDGKVVDASKLAGYVGNGNKLAGYVGNGSKLAGARSSGYRDQIDQIYGV